MCGIAGFYQSHFDYLTEEDHYRQILEDMEKSAEASWAG